MATQWTWALDDHVETAERAHRPLHCCESRGLIGPVDDCGAHLIAVLLYEILQATGIAGCCDEAIARCENSFRNVAAQTDCAASNQLHLKHQNPRFSFFNRLLANHRLAFWLADITLEPLAQLLGELLTGDEAKKFIGKLILEYPLET